MSNLTTKIATVLKKLRQERGWSLDVTSQKTGVSKAMLGQIERGESSPTIATLWKIASGFNVPFSSFIQEPKTKPPSLTRRKKLLDETNTQEDTIVVTPVFPFDETLGFEVFIIELPPGCTHLSLPHHNGVIEHVIAISGTIEVLIDHTWHIVEKNEGLRFAADLPHGYRNPSDTPVLFHNMIHYKKQ